MDGRIGRLNRRSSSLTRGIQQKVGFGLLSLAALITVLPIVALIISALWGIYGAIYFIRTSKAKGKAILLEAK